MWAHIGLFALVLGAFSAVFYAAVATALAPTFDIAPELTNGQAAEVAYQATVDQVRAALAAADLAVVVLTFRNAPLSSRRCWRGHSVHVRDREPEPSAAATSIFGPERPAMCADGAGDGGQPKA